MNTTSSFDTQIHRAYALVRFSGFVDASSVQQCKPLLARQLPASCRNIVVDLQATEFLDSHGVGLFVSLLKQAHKNRGRIVFVGATGQPLAILQMVGFNGSIVSYCETLDMADALFEQEAAG